MILKSNHEIVGTLTNVIYEGKKVMLKFSMIRELEMPADGIPKEKLSQFIGQRVGIFNHDGFYFIRKARKK